jgi:hypothetical protein
LVAEDTAQRSNAWVIHEDCFRIESQKIGHKLNSAAGTSLSHSTLHHFNAWNANKAQKAFWTTNGTSRRDDFSSASARKQVEREETSVVQCCDSESFQNHELDGM